MINPHQIVHVLRMWLDGDSGLENAIRKTADQGLFPEGDIRFAVEHLRNSVTQEKLEQWKDRAEQSSGFSADKSEKSDAEHDEKPGTRPDTYQKEVANAKKDAKQSSSPDSKLQAPQKNILCLHAGNLPLVGFQDVIAVMLSGNRYFGKISRKDPWLIASFLEVCQQEIPEVIGGYSTEIEIFSCLNADAVLFSGSEKSVKPVISTLERLGAVHPGTRYLIRTAQLSLAYIETKSSLPDLAEAVTRYSGRGCRSVGVVVSPMDFDNYRRPDSGRNIGIETDAGAEVEVEVEVEVETGAEVEVEVGAVDGNNKLISPDKSIREYSDETSIPENGLRYSIAFARAVGLPVFQLADQFIIQTSDLSMIRPGIVLWVKGGMETLDEIRAGLGNRLQTVYSDSNRLDEPGSPAAEPHHTFEPLIKAQTPDIHWMPDGVDTLEWIWRESGRVPVA